MSAPAAPAPGLRDPRGIVARVPTGVLVDGAWSAGGGAGFDVHDPATGAVLARVAGGGPEDGRRALAAATAAGPAWAATAPRARGEALRRLLGLVEERAEDLAWLITLEMGKPLGESRGEVAYAADFLRWYAEESVRLDGRIVATPDGRGEIVVRHEPVGPCLLITPWNFPLAMATRKVAPALAAGCTVVLKPSELTPLSCLLLAQLVGEAGVPDGVVNVVPTADAAALCDPLLASPELRKVSFTGSTAVGRRLLALGAANVLRASMELGGNAPLLVLDDADVDVAVAGALLAKLRNGGQSCVAANRVLVTERVADAFVEGLAAAMADVVVGAGADEGTELGPMIHPAAAAGVRALADDAVAAGARRLGAADPGPGAGGAFVRPVLLDHVPPGAEILRREIFGPVAPVVRVRDEAEAVEQANATPFGLAAYVFTRDLAAAGRVVGALRAGMVGLNQGVVSNAAAPFGGVGQSGLGREGGPEGIREYLDLKYVAMPRG